jgi:hypothetical protein
MKIQLFGLRIFLALVIIFSTLVFHPAPVRAWEQGASGTHEEINRQAVKRFFNSMSGNAKYENSPVDKTQTYLATKITSSSLMTTGLTTAQADLTFGEWLAHGGFSADEPHLWASVRHFYDPLSINGVPQLTDHNWVHGQIYNAISARKWAFEDAENPFNWRQALEYYKKSMEIPNDYQEIMVPGFVFRDSTIQIKSAAEARNVYLGKAFRALGENMHMIADLTQPAHVRNDSHPNGDLDPIESTANFNTVLLVKDSPVDPTIAADIVASANAVDMYEKIALWTNRNFYTDDTIYDKASGVKPRNWESSYPHPQFSDLVLEKGTGPKTYYKEFNGKKVRLAQQTYTSWKLGDSVWQDYIVPSDFVKEQAEVLMPIAIRANSRLINFFFPTLELSMEVKPNTSQSADPNYKEFAITSPFKHINGSDPDWQKAGLSIQYSGPGELWVETAGKERKLGNLSYKGGALEKPVAVFVGDKSKAKTDLYQVNDKDNIFIMVNAGGRAFKSNKYAISAQTDLTILPAEVTLAPGGKQTFSVRLSGAGSPQVTWLIEEGQAGGDLIPNMGVYTAPNKIGTYHVTVTLNSDKTKKATAVITVANVVVNIKPPIATVSPKGTQTFAAEVTGNPEKRVSWRVEELGGGTITADGVYTAPDKGGPYHVVATARADANSTARATVNISTPPSPTVNLIVSPAEAILVPGGKQEFRATVTGVADKTVGWWGLPGKNIPPQSADIPVVFEAASVGDYTITVTTAAEPRQTIQVKVKVVPGVWYFVNKTETTSPNIGLSMPAPAGGVTLSTGSAVATNTTRGTTSNWNFTWTPPPASLPVGQKFTGTFSVKDSGSAYDPKTNAYPMGSAGLYMQLDSSPGENIMFGAGREMQVTGHPFTSSASKNFSLTVPAGRLGGPQFNVRVDVVAEVNYGDGVSWTQQRGLVIYKYELRPQ